MDKQFRNLKQRQKEKINTWLFEEYRRVWLEIGHEPQPRYNQQILSDVMEKIEAGGVWIPEGEVERYFYRRKAHYRNRINRQQMGQDNPIKAEDTTIV